MANQSKDESRGQSSVAEKNAFPPFGSTVVTVKEKKKTEDTRIRGTHVCEPLNVAAVLMRGGEVMESLGGRVEEEKEEKKEAGDLRIRHLD